MKWTRAGLSAQAALRAAATFSMPLTFPPLSPMRTRCSNPCAARLPSTSVSMASNVSCRTLIVAWYRMCPEGGSMFPSGTSLMTGATRAFPSSRAIASAVACSTKLCLPLAR